MRNGVFQMHPMDYMIFERSSRLANFYSMQIRNRINIEVDIIHMTKVGKTRWFFVIFSTFQKGLKVSCGGSCRPQVFPWKTVAVFPLRLQAQQLRLEVLFPYEINSSKELHVGC